MADLAIFDETKTYRYSLLRANLGGVGRVVFILLNPSTADAENNDPTVARCVSFAKEWGYGTLEVLNIFALRSKNPETLYLNKNPVGMSNDMHIIEGIKKVNTVICGWGNHGEHQERGYVVREMIKLLGKSAYHLGLTKLDQPKHPLYLPSDSIPILWE